MSKRRMRFGTWCKKDPDDDTLITYVFKSKDGTMYFTSEDSASWVMIHRLYNAWIEEIKYVSNEFSTHWLAILYED